MTPATRKRFEAWFEEQAEIRRDNSFYDDIQLSCAEWGVAFGLRMAAEVCEAQRAHVWLKRTDFIDGVHSGAAWCKKDIESLLAQEEKK